MSEYNIPGQPRTIGDYPSSYKSLRLTNTGKPYCPECHRVMYKRKQMEGFNTWECSNEECPLIEGEYNKSDNVLKDIHYEASPIDFYVTEENET